MGDRAGAPPDSAGAAGGFTGDLDVFFDHSEENRVRLYRALQEFWGGSVSFREAWPRRVTVPMSVGGGQVPLHFIGLEELIRNKQAVDRPRDREDLDYLLRLRGNRQ